MDIASFLVLATTCSPNVAAETVRAIVAVESGFNPLAISVVGGALERQPRHLVEAVATARALADGGWSFSVGLGQINSANFERLGLTAASAFEPCMNLAALQSVLGDCYQRASNPADGQPALRRALSCYYSGNFSSGLRDGYVARVVAAARRPNTPSTTR